MTKHALIVFLMILHIFYRKSCPTSRCFNVEIASRQCLNQSLFPILWGPMISKNQIISLSIDSFTYNYMSRRKGTYAARLFLSPSPRFDLEIWPFLFCILESDLVQIGDRGTCSVINIIIRLINGIIRLINGIIKLLNGIIRFLNGIIRLWPYSANYWLGARPAPPAIN